MNSKTIQVISSQLSYEIFGNGEEVWIAFHGFGQSAKAFQYLANSQRKIYSFNLFFHHSEARFLSLCNWRKEMIDFLKKIQATQIHIIGFSIGSRSALHLADSLQESNITVNQIILIAPEVLAISYWYRFATQTKIGKLILTKLPKASFLQKMVLFFSKKIFNPSTHQLIEFQLKNRMNLVANTWLSYKDFEISRTCFIELSHKYAISIIASPIDTFVSFSKLKRNTQSLPISWQVVKAAHHTLLRESIKLIR